MMGTKARLYRPVPHVSLEELVPADHFYRHLDRVLDVSFVRDFVHESYAAGGRPSIDPVVFFKLQLVMFFEDIRSERLLMRLVADKLSVRWYVGYNLDEPLPDHSSLTRIRTRYGLEYFRRFFDAVVEQCQRAGLVWGRECYIDATRVRANADVDSLAPRFALAAKSTVTEHVTSLFPQGDASLPLPSAGGEAAALPCEPLLPFPSPESPTIQSDDAPLPEPHHDWYAEGGQPQREVTHGYRPRTADYRVSTTDPDATPMRLKDGGTRLGYQTHYVVDGGKRRIILAVLVAPGEVMENQPMVDLLWHTRFRWQIHPRQVTGDTTYGTLENIRAIEDEHIHAYVPLPNWEDKSDVWSATFFRYESAADQYRCPEGHTLTPIGTVDEHYGRQLYRAPASVCNACPVKSHCTTSNQGRRLYRSIYESYRERVQGYHQTEPYQKAIRKRKVWVEPLFAEAKEWHGLRRFRLRRLWRVNCEALLTASGQNIKRLLQHQGWGRRPVPTGVAAQYIWCFERRRGIIVTRSTDMIACFLSSGENTPVPSLR